jgi:hypothetical protein
MDRTDLQRLTKEELIELVLRMQHPPKTSRTSSKPPATDRKQRRDQAKPGGAKPGHEGHSRIISATPDEVVEHRPDRCSCCSAVLMADLPGETISIHEQIDLPEITPHVTQHWRLAVRCPACGKRAAAAVPDAAKGTPFGPRLHAVATYLKTFQALSYERLQAALADLFGLTLSQGGLMNLLRHRCSNLKKDNGPSLTGRSGSKTEELIDETDFACRSTFPLDAMAAADHAHDFKTLQRCGGGFHALEAARRTDHALERAMIRLKDVIQIFRGAVYHIVRQQPFVLQAQDCLGIRRQFVGRDG